MQFIPNVLLAIVYIYLLTDGLNCYRLQRRKLLTKAADIRTT